MAELPPALMAGALGMAGIALTRPEDGAERLGAHAVLRYAVGEEADVYRRVMRVLSLEHEAFGLRLRPAQVGDRLRERYGLSLDGDWLEERLARLVEWGALEREHDAALATSTAEWRRNRFTYDVTPAGKLTEGLLARLDELTEVHGRLEGDRLPAILKALARLADGLAVAEPDGHALRGLFDQALAEVAALHEGALAFMRSLGALIRHAEQVDEAEFERAKGALLEHLQGFRRQRRTWSADVLAAIDRVESAGVDRLVGTIVAAEEFVALPGGASVETQRERRGEELRRRWSGVRAWFLGDDASGSAWRTLNDQVLDAVRALLAIAERLIERRSERVDRARVHLQLAAQAAAAAPGDATAWVRAALGVRQPRHVGVPERDADVVLDRGRTSWRDAPPAPVVAHLRRPGTTAPGRGRGAPIADLREARAAFERRRAAERAELDALLRRFARRGRVRLSALERVDEREFAHLLAWIGRAYEAPAGPAGVRTATSSDGRALIRLRPPADPLAQRTVLCAPHGRLELPDFALEVELG